MLDRVYRGDPREDREPIRADVARRDRDRAPRLAGALCKAVALGLSLLAVGCTSISSVHLHRNEDDTKWKKTHLHGVPITLHVPTHIKIIKIQKYHLLPGAQSEAPLLRLPNGQPLIANDVRYELIYTDKIFTVDFKRPAAGTLKYKADFANQYITKIDSEIEDRTIKETAEAVDKILARIPLTGKATDTGAAQGAVALTPIESVVATAIFSLDDPALELKIGQFLETPGGVGGAMAECLVEGTTVHLPTITTTNGPTVSGPATGGAPVSGPAVGGPGASSPAEGGAAPFSAPMPPPVPAAGMPGSETAGTTRRPVNRAGVPNVAIQPRVDRQVVPTRAEVVR